MIIKTIVVSPFATNCHIAASESTKSGIVIDPGDDAGYILRTIEESGLSIKKIINTHAHVDHLCGAKELKDSLKAEFMIHKGDIELLKMLPMQVQLYGMKSEGVPEVEKFLEDGDIIEVDDISFKVIHTPGHSPGGICLSCEGVVFTGDTLFADSIGRTDLPGGSYQQLIGSIKERLLPLEENTVVYPGHGPTTTIGHEKRFNMFLRE
ncbi:MBL fold metallo-hydrolase [candidate division KSB1 bacterium]